MYVRSRNGIASFSIWVHLEAFDWNQLGRGSLHHGNVHKTFDSLFERGIDPEPGQLPADQPGDWPSLKETQAYVATVRRRIDSLWDEAPAHVQQTAVEHRWMHAETLAYLLHNLPVEQKQRPDAPFVPSREQREGRSALHRDSRRARHPRQDARVRFWLG